MIKQSSFKLLHLTIANKTMQTKGSIYTMLISAYNQSGADTERIEKSKRHTQVYNMAKNTMNTSNNTIADTIVCFHTGRGGQFYNAGHVTFLGEMKITDTQAYNDLFITFENQRDIYNTIQGYENLEAAYYNVLDGNTDVQSMFERRTGLAFGEKIYTDHNGTPVGLTLAEANEGIGCINIDGQYDTTCACYLRDCSDDELQLIVDYNGYVSVEVIEYAKNKL